MAKTKVLRCRKKCGQVEKSGKFPCGVCKTGVGSNTVLRGMCGKWIHQKCSVTKTKLRNNVGFKCVTCVTVRQDMLGKMHEIALRPGSILEVVDKFCYLGDMIGAGGGAEEASRARVRCSWSKFRELTPILTSRGATLKAKGRIYKACVQSVMVYGSETWAMKVEDMRRLERAERMMVRWMCGVTLKERKHSEELLARLGIEGVAEIVRRGRLRWYGHVERLNARESSKRDRV